VKRTRPVIASFGAVALLFASALVSSARGSFPGHNGRIAFNYGPYGILSMSAFGKGLRQLSRSGASPAYSPDGRLLAYGCGPNIGPSYGCPPGVGIRVRRADGHGAPRPLTRNREDSFPDWSPNGRRVVFTRYPAEGEGQLWIYHRGRSRRLTPGEQPAWSVRGEIAFERDFSLYVIRPDRSRLRMLARGLEPQWSPDGRWLIYNGNPGLYTIRRDGSGRRRLARYGMQPNFSPDGKWVVFTAGQHDRIAVIRRDGSDRRVIFRAEGNFVSDEPDWQSLPPSRSGPTLNPSHVGP
jgi:TolB protein